MQILKMETMRVTIQGLGMQIPERLGMQIPENPLGTQIPEISAQLGARLLRFQGATILRLGVQIPELPA